MVIDARARIFMAAGCLCAAPLGLSQTADLTVTQCPGTMQGDEISPVTVEYSADIHETGHRGVLLLEMVDAADSRVLLRVAEDNGQLGFEGPAGEHTFHVALPEDPPDQVFFRVCMTVYGLNDWVQDHLETYPTDGTYTYRWSGNGVTQNLYYLGGLVISNNSGNDTYCSGITFETFLLSFENYLAAQGLDPVIDGMTSTSMMSSFRRLWYGATGVGIEDEYQSTLAIERYDLGFILDDFEDARAGDFIQLWRHSGSGHNCIFQSWGRDTEGQINRLNYWSSQSSSNGIGYRSETVSATSGIDPARLHIARVMKPRAPDDWDLRFGEVDTAATPTTVGAGAPAAAGIMLR